MAKDIQINKERLRKIYNKRVESKIGFDRIRKMIANRCSTDYAAERVMHEEFSNDEKKIRHRLLITDEMRLIMMFEENFPSNGYVDCIDFLLALKKKGANIDLLSMVKLRTMLNTVGSLVEFFIKSKDGVYPNLKRISSSINIYPEILRSLNSILDKYGNIKDTASNDLFEIRSKIKAQEIALSECAKNVLRKAKSQGITDIDANVTVRDGKFLIPVESSSKRKIAGLVHDESATGKTSYIQPTEVLQIENELNELHFAESREIYKILSEFSEFIRPYIPSLILSAKYSGEIDFLMAKATTALDFKAGMPIISNTNEMFLRKARHPLLEINLKKENKEIVPLNITLTPQKHILLISGPNAGGKSVCLKTTGLLQYMFQWGMLIPTSETSEMVVFDNIMVSIGDDQSIDNDLSTYSSFLRDMKYMLKNATEKSLILIDEFGSGTEPTSGGAIAEAILHEMDQRKTYGVITTHYTNLKLYASRGQNGVQNGAMQFDVKNILPLFRLEIGLPGNSFAFEMARKSGLPEYIVKDAESRAGDEFVGIERNLRKIAKNKKAIDDKLQRIKHTDKTLDHITEKYQKELKDIKQLRNDIIKEAKKEAEKIVKEANKKVENTIRVIKETQAEKESTKEARQELTGFLGALEAKKVQQKKNKDAYLTKKLEQLEKRKEKSLRHKAKQAGKSDEEIAEEALKAKKIEAFRNAPLKTGEKVRIKSNGMAGEVYRVSNKSVTVIIGNLKSKLPLDKVERITSNEFKKASKDVSAPTVMKVDTGMQDRRLNFKPEVDLRGYRVNEALDIVTKFIDDAIMLNISPVRILHGKGTGALRDEIQRYVKAMPGIESVRDEKIQFGGSGVTIVTFE